MRKSTKTKIIFLGLIAVMAITMGLSCKLLSPSERELLEPIELTWWGVMDNPDDFREIITAYRSVHPNITINYRRLRAEEFEKELLDALAEDRGPDIFSIRNTWVNEYLTKIEPLPPSTRLAYEATQRSLGIKEETIIEVRETPSLTAAQVKNNFVDVVYDDVTRDDKVYGLPLSLDTLALFFNRDLLNNAGIPLPPSKWLDLQQSVRQATLQNQNGDLIQSGIALGRAENVEVGVDILSLLMMQNGAEMTDGRNITFGLVPQSFPDRSYNPGPEAVRFYTEFSDPTKEVYTWNETFPSSIDAFAEGRVAMVFGYNFHIPRLEAKRQGKLNYGIAKVPQIEGRPEINFANYWVQTVSKKSPHINEAWDFVQFATKRDQARKYLEKTQKPTALRSLIEEQAADDGLLPFVDQLLTAKSWYKGLNAEAMEAAMKEMITTVANGG
ncbi:extracellular solute-binding protein [Candidatus Falkowbacteria bacterium]|nr:extracellular solute-binding protein [Candidatus Falkowbacteria bacterium]